MSTMEARHVACFSTSEQNMKNITNTIESLMMQTTKIDMLYIVSPDVKATEKLTKVYKKYQPITVLNETDEFKDSCKLYPVLQIEKDPKTFILFVADDGLYHKTLINRLEKTYNLILGKTQNSAVVGVQGWNVDETHKEEIKLGSVMTAQPFDVLSKWGGVLLRREHLLKGKRDVSKRLLKQSLKNREDYCLSHVLHSNSIPRYVVRNITDKVLEPVTTMESDVKSANEKWNTTYSSKFEKSFVVKERRKNSRIRRDTPHTKSSYLKRNK